MNNIKILDCTLRDGGYVNNWNFKEKNVINIISNLTKAGIEYIECGFFKPVLYSKDQSVFSKIEQLEYLLPNGKKNKFCLMINYGEYDINDIPKCNYSNIIFRVAFEQEKMDEAIEYCLQLKNKGYGIFLNPKHTNTYSSLELLCMINNVNKLKPIAFTIVDTLGTMMENDIKRIYQLIENNLSKDIALCFHSHNNLQLSFSNAQCIMKLCRDRELVVDSTVYGMGRGAGNLCTELITQYINDNYNGNYDIVPILKVVDEQINPIFAKIPWGYSVPYYLAATNHCHPNYAKYLVNKQTVPVEMINTMLRQIPLEKKATFDKDLIKQLYIDYTDDLSSKSLKNI